MFYDYKEYYIYYNDKLTEISTKKSIITIFPTLKKEIKKYYKENNKQKEENIQLFYQNLFKTII
jgi:DNA-directed RNA polymerase delta subunit